jgi:putative endonuclease
MSLTIGKRGEDLIAQLLMERGWTIVARNWHCRWGELDIVALGQGTGEGLVFVEVKTRSATNLDGDGMLAVSYGKQVKLIRSAQEFLQAHPQWAEVPCRFDVALVQRADHYFLQEYIESAFEVS